MRSEDAGHDLPIDLPCEVRRAVGGELRANAAAGVDHLWLVDPDLRTLEAYAREGERWLLLGSFADTDAVRVPPFDAVALDLSVLWA